MLIIVGAGTAFLISGLETASAELMKDDSFYEHDDEFYFADSIRVTAIFRFPDGTIEWSPFQVFTQTPPFDESDNTQEDINNFNQRRTFDVTQESEFVLRKLVSETPKLYKFADKSRTISKTGESGLSFADVDVIISKNGETIRSFDYNKCKILDYFIQTQFDDERGWTLDKGHGFAVTDNFIFSCDGYKPLNPLYEKMNGTYKAKTMSSSDLRNTDRWGEKFSAP